jgi:DNA-binding transcriptional ArsR family regulator
VRLLLIGDVPDFAERNGEVFRCGADPGNLCGLPRCSAVVSALEGEPGANRMTAVLQELARVDRVIHEPARLMIMMLLYSVPEADFLYIQRECEFTQGNLSSHLSKLDEAGYVFINKMFKGKYPLTICSLTEQGRKKLKLYVDTLRAVCAEVDS